MSFLKKLGKVVSGASPLIGAATSLIGGRIAQKGQEETNAAQIALAREQMGFQERMSSTAYQRAAEDLEAAGLNRVLALGSPASSPGGAMAQLRNPDVHMGEGVADAPASAVALREANARLKNVKQQTKTLAANETQSRAQADLLRDQSNKVYAEVKEILERTRVHSAQGVIQGAEAAMYQAAGDLLGSPATMKAIEKTAPWLAQILRVFGGRLNVHTKRKK